MATNDTHPAVTPDSGPPSGPGLTLAPASSLTRQPACLPATSQPTSATVRSPAGSAAVAR